jgi:hypothetical protein
VNPTSIRSKNVVDALLAAAARISVKALRASSPDR